MLAYFKLTGRDPLILFLGIIIIIFLITISIFLININFKNNKIKKAMYIGFFIQLIIVIIDNYIFDFPLINVDARAHEGLAWFSYINNVNVGRGDYNYLILNPIYKFLGIRIAIIFGAINLIFNILINSNLCQILNILKINKKLQIFLMYICILSPISLIYRSGVLREAIIILFVSYSLKSFINYVVLKKRVEIIKMFVYLFLASLFHSGVIFLASGYFIYFISGKKNQKFLQVLIMLGGIIGFIVFKDQLLEKVGAGDIDRILAYNNSVELKSAGSGYLENISTSSLGQIVVYLPLFMLYFIFSPTPEMFRGILDIITFLLNSSIYIYMIFNGLKTYKYVRKKLNRNQKQIIKCLFISFVFTMAVFSVGTRNAGTAVRHRDKILPFLIIIFAIIKNRYFQLKYEKIRKGIKGR